MNGKQLEVKNITLFVFKMLVCAVLCCAVFAGIWSSVFSLSLTQLWSIVTGVIPSWASKIGEEVNHTGKNKAISMSMNT